MDLDKIQKAVGYSFQDERLLKQALVHKSYLNEKEKDETITKHNERLEFLGDAVLELVVTEYLFLNYEENEGVLTALRAALVNYKTMGDVGNRFGLDEEILLSQGEKAELGKARLTIVADCMEAIIGAMYLDGGVEPCTQFIKEKIFILLDEIISSQSYKDPKTLLQEYAQKHSRHTPYYKVLGSEGKDHEKVFTVGVWVGNENLAQAEGRSKQEAETVAAQIALARLTEQSSQDLH
jgi:ribonuclease-3